MSMHSSAGTLTMCKIKNGQEMASCIIEYRAYVSPKYRQLYVLFFQMCDVRPFSTNHASYLLLLFMVRVLLKCNKINRDFKFTFHMMYCCTLVIISHAENMSLTDAQLCSSKQMARTKQTARKATGARITVLPDVTHTPPVVEDGLLHTRCREEC